MRTFRHTASGYISRNTGTEGPSHDPYSFTEWTVKRGEKEATIHLGLGVWVSVSDNNHNEKFRQCEFNEKELVELFECEAGMTLGVLDRAMHRMPRMSPKERRDVEMCMEADAAMLRYAL